MTKKKVWCVFDTSEDRNDLESIHVTKEGAEAAIAATKRKYVRETFESLLVAELIGRGDSALYPTKAEARRRLTDQAGSYLEVKAWVLEA